MSIKRFEIGPRMSQAVAHNGTLYIAGQVAKGATVKEQTTTILRQIDSLMAAAGTDKTKILSATIWLVSMSTFAEMNSAWDAWVAPGNTPARATVESKLAAADYLVEIAVICAI
jgi:enamine deaminase RidA (YjgF/YER057c/UK114 family)